MLRLWFFFMCLTIAVSQSVRGTVYNTFGDPVDDVIVTLLNQNISTVTDQTGRFQFSKAEIGDSLLISHVSLKPARIRIDSRIMKITLESQVMTVSAITVRPDINTEALTVQLDLQANPVNNAQEILQRVPGMVIGQHAGGGKAEQIFLRGFDVDHGTDINISVDGLPVNMVSHAHGQGYADLHFVIPELIDRLDFGKGPYESAQGNFSTAGYVNFHLKRRLSDSRLRMEVGEFNTRRLFSQLSLMNTERWSAWLAGEFILTDGPFESPQQFDRGNLMGRVYTRLTDQSEMTFTYSQFSSQWDASGQIPQRLVDAGTISRFGAVDDTEGGQTSRTNAMIEYQYQPGQNEFIQSRLWVAEYEFELFSNFTFFLEDPINGDQIRQRENRISYGFQSTYQRQSNLGAIKWRPTIGIGFRNDESKDNELARTLNRTTTLESLQRGNIRETNSWVWLSSDFHFGNWFIQPGLRFDHFDFRYQDLLAVEYATQSATASKLSPKFMLRWQATPTFASYLKTGIGFHSNDTRVAVERRGKNVLPSATGADLGIIWKPIPSLMINSAIWILDLEDEYVYVGDAGITEFGGPTRRLGVDFSLRYQLNDGWLLNLDTHYAKARSINDPEGENYIPLAPDMTVSGGLHYHRIDGWFGGMSLRFVGDRPANEDNSIVAEGYAVTDANLGYDWGPFSLHVSVQNIFNVEWNETQFATESRLDSEFSSVEEIHFTPGTSRFFKFAFEYSF